MPAYTAQHCHAQVGHFEGGTSRCFRLSHDVLPEVPTSLSAPEGVEYRKAGDSGGEDAVGGIAACFPQQDDVAADYAGWFGKGTVLSFCRYP